MTTEDVPYRIRLREIQGDSIGHPVSMSESCGCSEEVRKKWVKEITTTIWGPERSDSPRAIRPWDLILNTDGSVEFLPVAKVEGESNGMYPSHCRIPPASIESLDRQEQVNRQERFAFGTLLYEIAFGRKPFERLSSDQVQQRYSNAEFPDDVRHLPPPLFLAVLSFWSVEFSNTINPPRTKLGQLAAGATSYIKAHPYLFALQVAGGVLAATAVAAPAILGVIGFGALGPIGGTIATGWQASIGIVEAGSLFAWCQSAAMGGAALHTIATAGVAGGGVAAAATAAAAAQNEALDIDGLLRKFKEVFRRA